MNDECIVCRVADRRAHRALVEKLLQKYPTQIHAPVERPRIASP